MKIEELFCWIIEKLKITTLGYHYSDSQPFAFNYPDNNRFQMAFDHKEGYVYDGIVLPDNEVINTEYLLQKYNEDSTLLTMITISEYLHFKSLNDSDANIVLCMFVLLHEIGHYYHFLSLKNEEEYIRFRKEYQDKRKLIDFCRSNMKTEQRLKCERQYWDLPGEKEAYDFAKKYLINLLTKYREEYGFPKITVSTKAFDTGDDQNVQTPKL